MKQVKRGDKVVCTNQEAHGHFAGVGVVTAVYGGFHGAMAKVKFPTMGAIYDTRHLQVLKDAPVQ